MDFREQLAFVRKSYQGLLKTLHLDRSTAIFRRVFLSDIQNQVALIRTSDLVDGSTAVSIVQQPPLPTAKIQLLAYHVDGPIPVKKRRLSSRHLLVQGIGQRHLWSTRLCAGDDGAVVSASLQTQKVFCDLIDTLTMEEGNLRDNCVRTWIYVRNIDLFYKTMVKSRRSLFEQHQLTPATHYIASTGIEGACSHAHDLVSMDAYSNLDLIKDQVSYLNDFDQLCRAGDYNVTFERGTRISYADRAHCYISGTASIDRLGHVVHPGDVIKQLERSLENIGSLLRSASARWEDMMYLIVYLRDPSDSRRVDAYLCNRFPFLPVVLVQGAVCRPAWLVEAEGMAIAKNHNATLPLF